MKSLMTYLNSKKTPQLTFEVFFYVFFFTKTYISTIMTLSRVVLWKNEIAPSEARRDIITL